MAIKKQVFIFFVLFWCATPLFSQKTVTIFGNAPTYSGDSLVLKTYSDRITYIETSLGKTKVAENGDFELTCKCEKTVLAFIYLGKHKGLLYIRPGKKYNIVLPPKETKTIVDRLNPYFEESEFYIGIKSDEKPLNYYIQKFDDRYNAYISENYIQILRRPDADKIERFIQSTDSLFVDVDIPYFNHYKEYQYAYLRHIAFERSTEFAVNKYFINKPVYHHNFAYMYLFNQLFQSYFDITDEIRTVGYFTVKEKSYSSVKKVMKKHIPNDSLCELVILKNMHESYFSGVFPLEPVLAIMDSIQQQTGIGHHKLIAKNIKAEITFLSEGYPAPKFKLRDMQGNPVSLSQFKGKYVYLVFCKSASFTCLEHFSLLKSIHEKHNDKLAIVTIMVDEQIAQTRQLIEKNSYDWTFLHFAADEAIIKKYDVKAYPTYYLIDPEGFLQMSPAIGPDENFEAHFMQLWQKYNIEKKRKQYNEDVKNVD